MPIKHLPKGELKDEVNWNIQFQFKDGIFVPGEEFVRPFEDKKGYLGFDAGFSFVCKKIFTKVQDRSSREVSVIVGVKCEAYLFLPWATLVDADFNINSLQAFKIQPSIGTPFLDGDWIGFQGKLRRSCERAQEVDPR